MFNWLNRDFWYGGEDKPVVMNEREKIVLRAKRAVADLKLQEAPFRVEFIVVHHSLTKDGTVVDTKAIKRFHTSWRHNGHIIRKSQALQLEAEGTAVIGPWSDIGYHFLAEKTIFGYKVMTGRPANIRGAHAKEGGMNGKSIGICAVGNFDLEAPPLEQWILTLVLVKRISSFYGVQNKNIIGHWESQALGGVPADRRKSCPGRRFEMVKFRREVATI